MHPRLVKNPPATPLLGHADGGPPSAQPPYFVRTVDFVFALAEFDEPSARAALPPTLGLKPGEPGFFGAYSAPSGWGMAPFTAFFVAVPVQGHDSPDGSCGYFMAEGFYSGRAGRIMHGNYNRRLVSGYCRQWNDGTVWHSEAGPGETHAVSIRARPVSPRPVTPLTSGVHHYLGERAGGGLNLYSVAYSAEFHPVEDISIDFTDEASPLLRSLRPLAIPYAALLTEAPLTFSAPSMVGPAVKGGNARSAQVALIDILSGQGRPAALVISDRSVMYLNAEADELLHEGSAPGQFKVLRGSEMRQLDRAIFAAGNHALPSRPSLLRVPDTARTLLVQILPVSAALAGEPVTLVLFSSLEGPTRTDPVPMLVLLGLTPAEARIAAQVGNGSSARQAAEALSLAENTVRSSLQLVYQKLGIGKQSELARIVTRLEGFGAASLHPSDQGVV